MTPTPKRGHASLRRGRASEPGRLYLATTTTFDRAKTFADYNNAIAAARVIESAIRPSALWCWVLMPDHWHGIVEIGDDDTLSNAMRRMKVATARAVNAARGSNERVWASAFHDHAIRDDQTVLPTARYVIANPVRAGIVKRVGDWPFWNAAWI